MMIYVVNLI